MLVLSRRSGQKICIGDDLILIVTQFGYHTSRPWVKLGFDGPPDIQIWREELINFNPKRRKNHE